MVSLASAIRQEGYAVLRGALPSGPVEEARKRCVSEFDTSTLWFGGGTILGHIAYTLPPDLDIVGKLIANVSVVNCASDILGSDFEVVAMGCNVNLRGSGFQPAHEDGDMDSGYLGVNLPLGDVDEENGSLELFAGTHRTTLTYAEFVRACREGIARRVNTSSGDVIIRYPSLWHRGTPNHCSAPRFMISVLLGRHGAASNATPLSLSPNNIAVIDRAGVRAHMAATDTKTGHFHPTYFPRTPRGLAKELAWRYTPPLYNLLRRLA